MTALASYDGPCDIRSEHGVMRLHCYLRPGDELSGYIDDRYREHLHQIAGEEVQLCLPGDTNMLVAVGDLCLRTDEPIGWEISAPEPEEEWWEFRGRW